MYTFYARKKVFCNDLHYNRQSEYENSFCFLFSEGMMRRKGIKKDLHDYIKSKNQLLILNEVFY